MSGLGAIVEGLRERVAGEVIESASLAPFTTFRVGGPADVMLQAESEDDLVAVAEVVPPELPIAVVGRGSNLLVSDEGFRGVAVRLGRAFRAHEVSGERLSLGGATYLPAVARLTARLGLEGFEFAAEIPATFGGAVRMNAGCHGRTMSDVLVAASVTDLRSGRRRRVAVEALGYSYRHSSLTGADIVTGGEIALRRGDKAAVGSRIAEHLAWRRRAQPPGRSAGSVFKNPPGDAAGRLIDESGGKGMRIGGAEVSEVHANFIVARPGASAADVWRLIAATRELVRRRTGIELEPEVRFLGAFPQVEDGHEVQVEG